MKCDKCMTKCFECNKVLKFNFYFDTNRTKVICNKCYAKISDKKKKGDE